MICLCRLPMRHALFLGILVYMALLFPPSTTRAQGALPPILISEVSIAGEKSTDEFIELYNPGDASFDLSGLQLRRQTAGGTESSIKVFSTGSIIPAYGFFLWANSQGIYGAPFADAETSSSALAQNNSIGLFTQSGQSSILLDSVAWGTGALFTSTTPILPNPNARTSIVQNLTTQVWQSTDTLTPTNSRGETWQPAVPDPTTPPSLPGTHMIRINEVLADPTGDETAGEFIELYNEAATISDISGFSIRDASKTGLYTFPAGTTIAGKAYLVLMRSVSKISLNNTNETLSLFDSAGVLIDSVHYDTTKEDVSQNRVGDTLRGGTPTPGQPNQLNSLPETSERVPKSGYHGVALDFDARGQDTDNGALKYAWNFGDGHKSYKETTTHTYEDNGTYHITLTTSDGQDDVVETFTIKISSFPKPNIHITSLVPNPSGPDTDHEWIVIENRDKKSIDLRGFGIATGWKKLVNHPIRERFVIKAGKSATLTRAFSLFTLPNQKAKIELRAPDGKILQTIKYKLDKSIGEDIAYVKKKGARWTWQESIDQTNISASASDLKTDTPPQISIPSPEETEVPLEYQPSSEKPAVLGVTTMSVSPNPYLKLLNYGTGVTVPNDIILSFPDTSSSPTRSQEYSFFIFAKHVLITINAALNAAQTKPFIGESL